MNRRDFLVATTAALALPAAALAGAGTEASPKDVLQALGRGETVFVDFYASWCTTCRAQERVINGLLKSDPTYEQNVSFFAVDWDKHKNSELARVLNIPRRSTLVVLKADREYGRIVAGTSKAKIKDLMDTAVATAGSS